MQEKVAGVDSSSFSAWARLFVIHVADRTDCRREFLLTYDAYRAHVSFRVLELFEASDIVIYALPAHDSGMTQPPDAPALGIFKKEIYGKMDLAPKQEMEVRFTSSDSVPFLAKPFTEHSHAQVFKHRSEK